MGNTPHLRWSRRLFHRFYVLLGQRTDAVSAIRRNPRGDAGEEQAGWVPYSRIRYVTIQVLGCYLFFDFPRVADNFQPKRTELQRITSERDRRFHTSPTQGSLGLSLQMFNIGCSRFMAIKRTYIPQLHVSTRHHPTAQISSSDPKFDLSNSAFPLRISKMWSVDVAGVKATVRMQYGDDPAGMSFGLLPFSEIPSLSSLRYCLLGSVSSYSFFTSLAPR